MTYQDKVADVLKGAVCDGRIGHGVPHQAAQTGKDLHGGNGGDSGVGCSTSARYQSISRVPVLSLSSGGALIVPERSPATECLCCVKIRAAMQHRWAANQGYRHKTIGNETINFVGANFKSLGQKLVEFTRSRGTTKI